MPCQLRETNYHQQSFPPQLFWWASPRIKTFARKFLTQADSSFPTVNKYNFSIVVKRLDWVTIWLFSGNITVNLLPALAIGALPLPSWTLFPLHLLLIPDLQVLCSSSSASSFSRSFSPRLPPVGEQPQAMERLLPTATMKHHMLLQSLPIILQSLHIMLQNPLTKLLQPHMKPRNPLMKPLPPLMKLLNPRIKPLLHLMRLLHLPMPPLPYPTKLPPHPTMLHHHMTLRRLMTLRPHMKRNDDTAR